MRFRRASVAALTLLAFGAAIVIAAQQAPPPDQLEIAVHVTGTIDYTARESGNYDMTVEHWAIQSRFSQSLDFLVSRQGPGRFGGAPVEMVAQAGISLFEPVMSILGNMTQRISGDIKITTCKTRTLPPVPVTASSMLASPMLPGGIDRGTFFVQGCAVNADRLLVFYLPPPGLYKYGAFPEIKCNEEYTFDKKGGLGAIYDASLVEDEQKAALGRDCRGRSRGATEDMLYVGAASWTELANGHVVTLTRSSYGIDGKKEAADEPYHDVKISATVTLEPDALRAKIEPSTVFRGTNLIADGSSSHAPRGHSIQRYEWTFSPEACPLPGRTTQATGVQVSFIAVCAVKARLVVTDDRGQTAEETKVIEIKARNWKTTLTNAEPKFEDFEFHPSSPVNLELGYNRCATARHFNELNPDSIANHWFEPKSIAQLGDYETGSFELSQVADGPFEGMWYVSQGHFDLKRTLWINSRLAPGDSVQSLAPFTPDRQSHDCAANVQCTVGAATTARFVRSIVFHEQTHSRLAAAALQGDVDPGPRVELEISQDRDALKDKCNRWITDAQTRVLSANTEARVQAAVVASGLFTDGGCVGYPGRSTPDGNSCYLRFATFAVHR